MIKIAVIDDEIQITSMLQKVLSKNNKLEISTYNNPVEALIRIILSKTDVVLLDFMMPHMNGMEVLNEIKLKSPSTKVIMMTACSDFNELQVNQMMRADDYLLKPFESLKTVERKVMNVISLQPEYS